MQPGQSQPYSTTGPFLITGILDIKYTLTVRNKFKALQEKSETYTPNDEYENFINAHLEAAATAECIPTKQRAKHRVRWETLAVRKKRADVKMQ